MLHIQTPPNCAAERAYILGVLCADWLGIPYTLTQTARADVSIRQAGQPGEIHLPDSFFGQFQRHSDAWLTAASLPELPLATWDSRELAPEILLTDPHVPVLFGAGPPGVGQAADKGETARAAASRTPASQGVGQAADSGETPTGQHSAVSANPGQADAGQAASLRLPIDLFGSAFFMLSRYEEAVLPERDHHDRFPASASLAYRAGFLDRPIIDEYVEILWAAMQRLWPGLARKPRQPRTVVSCDVDSPFAYPPWQKTAAHGARLARGLAGDLLKRRSPALAWRNWRGHWRARRGDHSGDPHRTAIEWIMEVNEAANRAVAFYFIPENTDPRLDNRVSLDHLSLRALLRLIHARGHEIGIHPGYHTYRHPEALARSVATLRRVLDAEGISQPLLGGRQHFLRWETPTTARLWDANGLDYDSTLSYADRPGFRCGTCREYPLYDLHQRRPLRLRERPLIVMECSVIAERYLGLGYSDQALDLMQGYRDTCHRFGGDFTLLWHNSHLGTAADRRFYRALVGENAADVASLTH